MKKSIFLTVLLGLLFASTASALEPGDTLWTRIYDMNGFDYGQCVRQTTDGGYIITGGTGTEWGEGLDIFLLKLDSNGDTLWARTYGGSGYDYGYSVQQTDDGGYVIAGGTGSFGAGEYDFYLLKTDANGDTLWTRTYGGRRLDHAYSVEQTTDGGYIIAGESTSSGPGGADFYLVKTDANGNTLWTRNYYAGRSDPDYAYCVQQTSDGGYILAGYTSSSGPTNDDIFLVKTDPNGDTLWTRTYGGNSAEYAWSVQQTGDGGFVVAGCLWQFSKATSEVYLLRTDSNGDTLWTGTYGLGVHDRGHSVQVTSDGGYIIAGYSYTSSQTNKDFLLVKTDSLGNEQWARTYQTMYSGGTATDEGQFGQQTDDGGYIIVGFTWIYWGYIDIWLVRVEGEAPGPEVSIEITPDDPPVVVPQGGSFGYTGTVTNNTDQPQTLDLWLMAEVPGIGMYGPIKRFNDVPLSPYQVISRHLSQSIPSYAPLGNYLYLAYCGDYPSTVIDSSYFPFEVIAGAVGMAGAKGWSLTGSFMEGDNHSGLPSEFGLLGNYPNPFNASTLIEYQLPEASEVTLQVYNLSGQKVATLVSGKQEAGYKSVLWDASQVSSGLYFYKLDAGDFSETKRMMLVK